MSQQSLSLRDPVIPDDVEKLFQEERSYIGPVMDNDDDPIESSVGLRWQYKEGIITKEQIEDIVSKDKILRRLIDSGEWKP